MDKPEFDPNKPFETVDDSSAMVKPEFNPDQPFENVDMGGEFSGRTLASVAAEQNPPPPAQEVSASRAALVGAGQGLTFGFNDELTAPIHAAAGMMGGDLPTLPDESTYEKFKRLMQTSRDVSREEQQAAQDQHPVAYTGGAIGGGLLVPGLGAAKIAKTLKGANLITKAGVGAGVGAAYGGVAGAGEAEGGLEERLEGAKEGAEMGAGIGAVLPIAGAGLKTAGKAISKIGELPFLQKMKEAFSRGAKGENLITEGGRRKASDNLRGKSGELYDDIKSIQDNLGGEIEKRIQHAKDSGERIDLNEEVTTVLEKLQKIKSEGSKEAAAYAASVESEIKKLLKIKPTEEGFMGVASKDLPEGLALPKKQPTDFSVDAEQAQDLKQVMQNYSPRKGMAPQEIEPAGIAKELKSSTSDKLNELTGLSEPQVKPSGGRLMSFAEETSDKLPSINEQYGLIKDSLKRLTVNEKQLPEQITQKINKVMKNLGKEGSGDDAREILKDVIDNLKQIDPALASKYETEFADIAGRLKLSEEITKGMQAGLGLGTVQSMGKGGANLAGLVANKTGLAATGKAVASTVKNVTNNPLFDKATIIYKTQGAEANQQIKKATEPYKLQRQVAQAAENADPELLKEQANQIREKHGTQGEQLATILDNMVDKDKMARRALMFTVLQNAAYRKMLGLSQEERDQ